MSDKFFPSELFQEKPEEKAIIEDLNDLNLDDTNNVKSDQICNQQIQKWMICECKNVSYNEYIDTNEQNQQILQSSLPTTSMNGEFRFGPGGDPGPEKFKESLEEYGDDNIANKINFDIQHDYYDNDIDSIESYFEEDYFDETYF